MAWIPVAAWIAALVVAVVVLGFCAYELLWKTKRLRTDLAGLQSLTDRIGGVQAELAITQQRLAAVGER